MNLAEKISFARKEKGLTQEQLASQLGVSRSAIAKWESGESLPDIERCAEICFAFDVSIDAFVTFPLAEENAEEANPTADKYVFGIVKVGERGQVVIPKYARSVYDIKAGDKLLAVGDGKGMALAKIKGLSQFHFDK